MTQESRESRQFGDSPEEEVNIQVDCYGIKGHLRSSFGDGGEQPDTWKEVWERAQHHLRRICVDLPGGIADGLSAVRAFTQGIGSFVKNSSVLPRALAMRIAQSHAVVEAIEDQKQSAAIEHRAENSDICKPVSTGESRLRNKLTELRKQGYVVDLLRQADGSWIIVLLPPSADDPSNGEAT